jgi:cyclohexadienyl dehydratase
MTGKTLTVGTTGDYRPLTWFDPESGRYVGRAIDLVEAFAAAAGYEVTFVRTTWPTMMDDLVAGRFRMAVGGISQTAERAKRALLSDPVATGGKVALVRAADKDKYGSLDAINRPGTRVVENRGGTNERFARAETDKAHVIIVPDNALPFEYLEEGKADVMFTDSIEAVYQARHDHGLSAVHPDAPYTHADKVFLFRKDERALHDAFDRWLEAARRGSKGGAA